MEILRQSTGVAVLSKNCATRSPRDQTRERQSDALPIRDVVGSYVEGLFRFVNRIMVVL